MFTVEKMESIPPNSNPFTHDFYNMGHDIGKNLVLMYGNHQNEPCQYLIVVNTKTGERTRLVFPQS